MKIWYLDNSGFCLEQEGVLLVFDCWKFPKAGEGGEGFLSKEEVAGYSSAYIFVSHVHGDHFNKKVFGWAADNVTYLVDEGVPVPPGVRSVKLKSGGQYQDGKIRVLAHPSTDLGVSFQVEIFGKTIFHAGDLNCWHWAGDNTEQEERQARAEFTQALEEVSQKMPRADVTFFPVDPRLGPQLDDGALEFLRKIEVGLFVPMHFGQEFAAAAAFAKKMEGKARVFAPARPGDSLEISC